MGTPVIAQAPDAVLVAVEDPNLAVHGTCRAAVAICIECDSLDEISVAVGEVEVEVCLFVNL